jgi:hypothetical protein
MGSAPNQLSVVTPGRISWPGPFSQTGRGMPPWAGARHQPGGYRGPVLYGWPWKKGHKRGAFGARIFHNGGIRPAKRVVAWPSGSQR